MDMRSKRIEELLKRLIENGVGDTFHGHRGRPGKRGGSVPRTEHETKHENAQYEDEAGVWGTKGTSIKKIIDMAKEHQYTAKEHKNLKDRSLVLVKGSDIPGSKFKGYQLYRYNKKDKCLESSYGDNPKLYLKDLKGKKVRTFIPTSDTVNKDTIHLPRRKRIADARKENETTKKERLVKDVRGIKTKQQKRLIASYTGTSFATLNDYLRTEGNVNKDNGKIEGPSNKTAKTIKAIADIIGQNKLSKDTTLYRVQGADGVLGQYKGILDNKKIPPNMSLEDKLNALVGEVGQENGFMSTSYTDELSNSINTELPSDPVVHEIIFSPKGTKAVCVEESSLFEDEKEVLVQRGTKMLFRRWWKDKNGEIYIEKEIVN